MTTAEVSKLLTRCELPRGTLAKLMSVYHPKNALQILRKDPYGVLQSIDVSLEHADRVAGALKLPLRERTLGYARWLLRSRSMNMSMLTAKLQFAFECPSKTIRATLEKLVSSGDLVEVDSQIVSLTYHQKNVEVAREIKRRVGVPAVPSTLDAPKLTVEQRQAVINALSYKISIISGGPGSGKSHVVRELVQRVSNVRVTAPTGRAARNASGKTVHYFKTIQETGKNDFHGAEMIIVDEASMLSLELFEAVLSMTPKSAHVVLVGDVDQLPPIDSGDVLRDLIRSGLVPVTWLTMNIRSTHGIQTFARGVLEGKVEFPESGDVEILPCETFDDVLNSVPALGQHVGDILGRLCTNSLNLDRYVILTPHNATRVSLNKAVQLSVWCSVQDEVDVALVKDFADAPRGTYATASMEGAMVKVSGPKCSFKTSLAASEKLIAMDRCDDGICAESGCVVLPGDRVIVTKNTTTACNGDMGIYEEHRRVVIGTDTLEIPAISETDPGLTLAYAVTVHKAQGSEFNVVVLPVTNVSAWDRTLLYTAITRARNKVYVMGTVEDIKAIVNTVRPPRPSILGAILN